MAAPGAAGHEPGSAGSPDPSMDDILASIRRILNEEEATTPTVATDTPSSTSASKSAAAGATRAPPGDAGEHDVFELDQSMMLPDADPPFTSHGPVPEPPPVQASDYPRGADAPEPHPEPTAEPAPNPAHGTAAVTAPLAAHDAPDPSNLTEPMRAITVTNQPIDQDGATDDHLIAPATAAAAANSVGALVRTLARERTTQVNRGGPTIEDLVRDEIRPVLKEWLDNHLPPMVERLVRAEIERVVHRQT